MKKILDHEDKNPKNFLFYEAGFKQKVYHEIEPLQIADFRISLSKSHEDPLYLVKTEGIVDAIGSAADVFHDDVLEGGVDLFEGVFQTGVVVRVVVHVGSRVRDYQPVLGLAMWSSKGHGI